MIPYGRQWVDEEDIQQVGHDLRSDWLTTGSHWERFEVAVGSFVRGEHGRTSSQKYRRKLPMHQLTGSFAVVGIAIGFSWLPS